MPKQIKCKQCNLKKSIKKIKKRYWGRGLSCLTAICKQCFCENQIKERAKKRIQKELNNLGKFIKC